MIGKLLFGDKNRISLECRIFSTFQFLIFLSGLFGSIGNVIINVSVMQIYSSLTVAIGGFTLYFFSRWKGIWEPLVIPASFFFLGTLTFFWFAGGGTHGAIWSLFIILNVGAVILLKQKYKLFSSFSITSIVIILITVEYFKPSWIIPYATRQSRYIDFAITAAIVLIITGFSVYMVFIEYKREQAAKERLLADVRQEKEIALKAIEEKRTVISMVCHDIANALCIIINSVQLQQGKPIDNDSENLELISFATENISEIIESVRTIEALESGKVKFDISLVRPRVIFEKSEKIFSDRLNKKNIRLNIMYPESGDVEMAVEPLTFCNHVFNNVLSNAIKFSYPDSVINVTVCNRAQETAIVVSDTGIGIPPRILNTLFDSSARNSRPGTLKEKGTGFGMPVVKRMIEAYGGRIEIESKAIEDFPNDHGTTVSLYLKNTLA